MASPFRIFRRHQKALLIVAGVVLMLVFVLADSLQMLMGDSLGGGGNAGRPDANAVAVRWNDGELTNAELNELVFRRRVVNGFLGQIYQTGAYAEQMQAISTGVAPRRQPNVDFVGERTMAQQGVEADVVRVRLFAEAAREAGMTVSDDMIGNYLDELGFGRVSRDDMGKAIRQLQADRGVTVPYVFDALREELLAHNYQKSHAFAISTVLPTQRWNDWRRLNDRVSIEAAAFPAESFLVDVPEPSDAEVAAFLEQKDDYGRRLIDREPQPDFRMTPELPSRFPGFKIPRKIDVQYVRADFNAMLEKVKSELTDEEIQKYYDENKDPYFIKADLAEIDKPADAQSTGGTDAKQETDAGKQPGAAEGDGKNATTPAVGSGEAGQPAGVDAGKNESAAPPASAPPRGGNESAAAEARNVFRLASFVQDEGKAEAQPAQTPTISGTGAQAEQVTIGEATGQPVAGETTPALNQPTTTGAAEPATESTTPAVEAPKKPVEFQPLEEVREEIRRALATPKVHERLDTLVDQVRTGLNAEFNKYFTAYVDADAAKKPLPTPPAALADLSTLAQTHGLEHRRTGEMSALQLRDDAVIGKLIDIERSNIQYQAPILSTLFSKETDLYKPIVTVDLDNNRFIVMKTSDTPGRVPPLAEIRDAVVRAWKLEKAATAAKKHADEAAKKAQEAGIPLAEYFANEANVKVLRTEPFAWLTSGDVPLSGGQLRWSQPEGIEAAGREFMSAVFELNEGQVGSALNHDWSIAYVFRIAEHQIPEDKLREIFLTEASTWLGFPQMQAMHRQEAQLVLTQSVLEAAGYEALRPLDPIEEE